MTLRTVSKRLDRYTAISSTILALVGVSTVLSLKFNFQEIAKARCGAPKLQGSYLECLLGAATSVWHAQPLPIVLAAATFAWFFLYHWAIKAEKRLLDEVLYLPSVDKAPKTLRDEALIVGLAIAIPCIFIFLAWTVDRVSVYCFAVVALGLADLVGNNIIRTNLESFLADASNAPTKTSNQNFVIARRKVARWYWLECQHYQRVSLYVSVACVALFIATNQDAELGLDIPTHSAYWILFLALTLNEGVMGWWRYLRHRKLSGIADAEEKAIRAQAN